MARGNDLAVVLWVSVDIVLAIWAIWMARQTQRARTVAQQERVLREELESYAVLDPALAAGESPRGLARRVCATVARNSSFRQVAMLMRDAENRLNVVGGAGVDDMMTLALNEWGARFAREQRKGPSKAESDWCKSYPVTLGPMETLDVRRTAGLRGCRQVIVLPFWSQFGMMRGALVVWPVVGERETWAKTLMPLEALATKLSRSMDVTQMSDRLVRSEKMAGLGHLAKGVAHELNNPLTAVLGFAELIAETACEPRVREDAVAIVGQAMRMKETIDSLTQFWRPVTPSEVVVNVAAMLRGLVDRATPEMARRGMRLVLEADDDMACHVRGDEQRLLEVFEHLLNNAVQAVAAYAGGDASVRVTLTCDGQRMRVAVSDSGVGFAEPARVFDPFYTTRQPGEGQGMGLAISYGIVREHGGDISAFNVHPHGAAVVVELPLAKTVMDVAEIARV